MTDLVFVPGDRSHESSSSGSVVVDKTSEYNYDLTQAPKGKKCIVLTIGGIGTTGRVYGDARDNDVLGWFPMPGRNLEKEAEVLAKRTASLKPIIP